MASENIQSLALKIKPCHELTLVATYCQHLLRLWTWYYEKQAERSADYLAPVNVEKAKLLNAITAAEAAEVMRPPPLPEMGHPFKGTPYAGASRLPSRLQNSSGRQEQISRDDAARPVRQISTDGGVRSVKRPNHKGTAKPVNQTSRHDAARPAKQIGTGGGARSVRESSHDDTARSGTAANNPLFEDDKSGTKSASSSGAAKPVKQISTGVGARSGRESSHDDTVRPGTTADNPLFEEDKSGTRSASSDGDASSQPPKPGPSKIPSKSALQRGGPSSQLLELGGSKIPLKPAVQRGGPSSQLLELGGSKRPPKPAVQRGGPPNRSTGRRAGSSGSPATPGPWARSTGRSGQPPTRPTRQRGLEQPSTTHVRSPQNPSRSS
jgi:hypothetical protein